MLGLLGLCLWSAETASDDNGISKDVDEGSLPFIRPSIFDGNPTFDYPFVGALIEFDEQPKPFRWTKSADEIIELGVAFFSAWLPYGQASAAVITFDSTNTYVTSIEDLTIGAKIYDVSFHLSTSFNDLFDPDADSDLDGRPVFLDHGSDPADAIEAAIVITKVLGTDIRTSPSSNEWDVFLVPYAWSFNPNDDFAYILAVGYKLTPVDVDRVGVGFGFFADAKYDGFPIATYREIEAFPLPSAAWLVLTGLGVLGHVNRRSITE